MFSREELPSVLSYKRTTTDVFPTWLTRYILAATGFASKSPRPYLLPTIVGHFLVYQSDFYRRFRFSTEKYYRHLETNHTIRMAKEISMLKNRIQVWYVRSLLNVDGWGGSTQSLIAVQESNKSHLHCERSSPNMSRHTPSMSFIVTNQGLELYTTLVNVQPGSWWVTSKSRGGKKRPSIQWSATGIAIYSGWSRTVIQ